MCQFYPNAAPAAVVTKFFMIYKDWYASPSCLGFPCTGNGEGRGSFMHTFLLRVSQRLFVSHAMRETRRDFSKYDISLCPIEDHPHGWRLPNNPWNTRDNGNDLMPVLTTSYPAINTCHNVIASTMQMMKNEWSRGYALPSR